MELAPMVECKDCLHFKRFPGDTVWKRRTGCYHPENMEQKLSERIHQAQEIPGDHEKINAGHDCAQFTARPRRGSLISRLITAMKT